MFITYPSLNLSITDPIRLWFVAESVPSLTMSVTDSIIHGGINDRQSTTKIILKDGKIHCWSPFLFSSDKSYSYHLASKIFNDTLRLLVNMSTMTRLVPNKCLLLCNKSQHNLVNGSLSTIQFWLILTHDNKKEIITI